MRALFLFAALLLGGGTPPPSVRVLVDHSGVAVVALPQAEVALNLDLAWHGERAALYGLCVQDQRVMLRRWDGQGRQQQEWVMPEGWWPYTVLYLRDNVPCVVAISQTPTRPVQELEFREAGGRPEVRPRGGRRWWHELLPELDGLAPQLAPRLRGLCHRAGIHPPALHAGPHTAVEIYPVLVGGLCPGRGFSAELEGRGVFYPGYGTDWDLPTGRLVATSLFLELFQFGAGDQVRSYLLEGRQLAERVEGVPVDTRRVRIAGNQILAEIWTTQGKDPPVGRAWAVRLELQEGRLQVRHAEPGRLARLLHAYPGGQ